MSRPKTLLLVEDEPWILSFVRDELEAAGYSVVSAPSSDEAIIALDNHAETLSGLVTDIRLPGHFDGWAVARQARSLNPLLPVLYVTGHGADEWLSRGVANSALLQKPFVGRQVVRAIDSLIEAGVGTER